MAAALENFVSDVQKHSAEGNFHRIAEMLPDTADILMKNWSLLDNVLETLDFQQHSLGVLYVLLAKFSTATANADPAPLVEVFKRFIKQCNGEQVRYATHAYYDLCHLFTNLIVNQPNCIQGIKILAQAIEKIRKCDSQLTCVHADLYQLSLKAKCFKTALSFLNIDITTIATASEGNRGQIPSDTNNEAKYFLLYYYYGGMIYTAVKNYDRALYFFEVCISTPAMAMSHIMLEAYKKFILVSLIMYGKIHPIPKHAQQIISRLMKPHALAYYELSNAYATTSNDELRNAMNKNVEIYMRDKNMGLVKQVATSLYKKNILRLTKTFLTLSLSDVASRAHLSDAAEAEKYILNMIKSGEIYATINQKDGMVVFKDDPEKYDSPEMFLKVQEDMTRLMESIKQINKMDEEILLNPMYVKKALGNQEDELSQHAKTYSGDPTD